MLAFMGKLTTVRTAMDGQVHSEVPTSSCKLSKHHACLGMTCLLSLARKQAWNKHLHAHIPEQCGYSFDVRHANVLHSSGMLRVASANLPRALKRLTHSSASSKALGGAPVLSLHHSAWSMFPACTAEAGCADEKPAAEPTCELPSQAAS